MNLPGLSELLPFRNPRQCFSSYVTIGFNSHRLYNAALSILAYGLMQFGRSSLYIRKTRRDVSSAKDLAIIRRRVFDCSVVLLQRHIIALRSLGRVERRARVSRVVPVRCIGGFVFAGSEVAVGGSFDSTELPRQKLEKLWHDGEGAADDDGRRFCLAGIRFSP